MGCKWRPFSVLRAFSALDVAFLGRCRSGASMELASLRKVLARASQEFKNVLRREMQRIISLQCLQYLHSFLSLQCLARLQRSQLSMLSVRSRKCPWRLFSALGGIAFLGNCHSSAGMELTCIEAVLL